MKLATRILVALLTFLIGVGSAALLSVFRQDEVKPVSLSSLPPCRQGCVSVEPQPNVPLRVSVLNAACTEEFVGVEFVAENIGSKPISRYEIRGVRTYERSLDSGLGVSTQDVMLQPHESRVGHLGGGIVWRTNTVPFDRLASFKLSVWSIVFADGTTWTSLPPE